MGQLGFFDLSRRYEGLDWKDDLLAALASWRRSQVLCRGKRFGPSCNQHWPIRARAPPWRIARARQRASRGTSSAIFKALVMRAHDNPSDEQMEYQLRDQHSLMRFLALALEDRSPRPPQFGPARSRSPPPGSLLGYCTDHRTDGAPVNRRRPQ